MNKINPNQVYTTKEAQDFLKVSKSTIKRYLKQGIIRAKKVGGRYKILGKELLGLVSPELESKAKKGYLDFRKKIKDRIKDW
ncbi:MAG: helix-turn-helix domain-containing protein [Candidatus Pacebacteria bacterium]|nr:helix-turn-helix domain-containing protein [Candidatus Paceibacterota bacterium]